MTSASHSFGLDSGLTRDVGALTDEVVKAFGRRYSSTGIGDWVGGGGVRRGWGGSATWLFLRWSGVDGRDDGGELAANVGDEVSEPAGMLSGSNSRSGMGGESNGRRVIRSKASRSNALRENVCIRYAYERYDTHFTTSSRTMPFQRVLCDTFLRSPISSNNSVKRINSGYIE